MIRAIHLTDRFFSYGGGELFLTDLVNNSPEIRFLHSVSLQKPTIHQFPIPVVGIDDVNKNIEADVLFFWGPVANAPQLFPNVKMKIMLAMSDFNVSWFLGSSPYATHAIALSESTRKAIQFPGPCAVIHAGIDFSKYEIKVERQMFRQALGFRDDDFVVGQFCRMVKFKNVEMTVNALTPMPAHVKLLLLGTGSNLNAILDLCEEKLPRRHQHVSYVDHNFLGTYYNCLDAFCLPSKGEGFARVQWEAMYFGIPFIGTPVGGVPDVIENGVNGFVIATEEHIRQAVLILHDKRIARAVGDAGHQTAKNKGTINLTARRICTFIKEHLVKTLL